MFSDKKSINYHPVNSSLDELKKEKNLLVLKRWKRTNIKWRDARNLDGIFDEFLFLKDIKDSDGKTLMLRVESYLFTNPYKAIGKLYIIFPRDIPIVKKEYDQAGYFERMYAVLGWRTFWHVIYSKRGKSRKNLKMISFYNNRLTYYRKLYYWFFTCKSVCRESFVQQRR